MMRVMVLVIAVAVLGVAHSAPVNPQPSVPKVEEGTDPTDDNFLALEYKKYLEEVVQVLESDPDFKKELDKMNADGQKDLESSGQIAHYLQFANKNTRTKLDELKRLEVRRLRDLHKKLMKESADEIRAGKRHPSDLPSVDKDHVDHDNPHTFEIDDLKKLIKKTTDDLADLDKKRKDEFKKYEMNKEHEYRQKLKHAKPEDAEKLKKEHEEQQKRHKDHPKVHHPGNKEQLEEVWKEDDDMKNNEFDPKAFFMLHDIDGDGYLNTHEIEALFQNELDKVYNSSNPDDDMVERDEEMNRMREHVFNEIDKDKDGLVSLEEFLQSTKSDEFKKDDDWDTLDDEDPYNSQEYDEYEKALAEQEEKYRQEHPDEDNEHGEEGDAEDHEGGKENGEPAHPQDPHANDPEKPSQ